MNREKTAELDSQQQQEAPERLRDDERRGGKDRAKQQCSPRRVAAGHQRRNVLALGHGGRQGELLMRFLCALLFLKFYAGVSSQCEVTSKELLTGPTHPFPSLASEEGRTPPLRDLQGHHETLQRRWTWSLAHLKSLCNSQACACRKEVGWFWYRVGLASHLL